MNSGALKRAKREVRRAVLEDRDALPPGARAEWGERIAERFAERFEHHWLDGMRAKLGLFTEEAEDRLLVDDLLAWMQLRSADFTNTFRTLSTTRLAEAAAKDDPAFDAWHRRLQGRRRLCAGGGAVRAPRHAAGGERSRGGVDLALRHHRGDSTGSHQHV